MLVILDLEPGETNGLLLATVAATGCSAGTLECAHSLTSSSS